MDTMLSAAGKELYMCGTSTGDAEACPTCTPKFVLSPEEQSILETMREVKAKAKPVSDRLKELAVTPASVTDGPEARALSNERDQLTAQLEGLRAEWKEWQHRLDEAIEAKHVALGHRVA